MVVYLLLVLYVYCLMFHTKETKQRTLNLLIAIDQLVYVIITLGNGSPDETMSAAAWRLELEGHISGKVFRPFIDFLFRPIEKDHCYLSYKAELNRSQLSSNYKMN